MIVRWTSYSALLVYGLSIFGIVLAPNTGHGSDPMSEVGAAPALPVPETPLRGFAISLHHTEQLSLYLDAIDQIASLGFNCVEIATPAYQTDGAAHEIRIETGPGRGPSRSQLVKLLKHAKRRGLTVALMPQVLFTDPRGNEWRGKIHPDQWDPWWRDYRKMVDYFLDVANEVGVDIFCVGSELLTTERQTDRWISLINHARSHFDGWLTYSTNWDHYHVPTVWDRLDMIGVSGYWNMTEGAEYDPPTADDLANRWRDIRKKLLAFAEAQNRPILFTEIGYPSLPWALKDPWNYVNGQGAAVDTKTQAAGYQAFVSAWDDLLIDRPNTGLLSGVFFYAWDPYHAGGDGDTGYGVRGKPALDLLRWWLSRDPR